MTPKELQDRYSIKREAYYNRLKFLGIKALRDSNGKAYLNSDQVALLDELHSYIKKHRKMSGFPTPKNAILEKTSEPETEN